jgi:hypothetical protein
MQMLLLRPATKRKDGARRMPIVRERYRKYGPVIGEKCLSIKRDILITGPNASGKTRWLTKFHEKANEVWNKKEVMFIRAVEPMHAWYGDERVKNYAEAEGKTWSKLQSFDRVEMLVQWVKNTKAVLIIDDLQMLGSRKLDIIRKIIMEAGILVCGAFAEQRIPITLRLLIDSRNPQKVNLKSDAAYDSTNLVMWFVVLICIATGAWQIAAIITGMKVLGGGKRAAVQK